MTATEPGLALSATASRSRWTHVRLGAVGAALLAGLVGLGLQARTMQIEKRDVYKALAEEQYLREIELPAHRGRILDRIGTELAASALVDSIYANPHQLDALPHVRREEAIRKLAQVLHLDRKEVQKRLTSERHFVWLKRRVLPEEAHRVQELAIPGIGLTQESRRYYPNRGLAGPVLGWAGLDSAGLEGVELAYDRFLRGSRASILGLKDARGRDVLVGGVGEVARERGHDVYLTIDKFIQFRLEQVLEEGVTTARARAGVAVAMDPKTGEILAIATVPSLNPNDPSGARERGVRNRAVTDPFEPGSTIKPFTVAAALEAGAVRPTDEWNCEGGQWRLGKVMLHDAEPEGILTTAQVLARSSNIGAAKIARRVGKERLYLFLRQLGFFAPTGVDLPGERAGQVRPVHEWGDVAFANISFGQGMTATPIQLAAAFSALANGGTLYRPRIVQKIVSPSGQVALEPHPDGRRVMSARTAATLKKMLRGVMQKKGTGEKIDIPVYPVAGKTGTAQKVDPATRRYSPEFWASSFVGFAPYDDPRLLLFVLVDEPREGHYGAAVAGPIFTKVMSAALPYLGVPPRPDADAPASPPAAVPVRPPALPAAAAVAAGPPRPEGIPTDTVPAAERVPDFSGLGLGRALEVAQKVGLRVEVSGSGLVVAQEPAAGSRRTGPVCQLRLAPPQ